MIQDKIPEFIHNFVGELEKLDAGERARFKRNAGNRMGESRNVLGLFYKKLLHDRTLPEWAEEPYFLIATLYPFEIQRTARSKTPGPPPPPNLGASLRAIRKEKNGEGMDRRFERLLDADEQQFPFLLRREVQFLVGEGGRVHWAQLLHDILRWQHPFRTVQRRWARVYFSTQAEADSAD
jgi:CRISPR system Cascade subunit CasB